MTASTRHARDAGVHQIPAAENPWVEVLDGFALRVLRVAADNSTYSMMARFQPGFQMMTHHHDGAVHAYTLSGVWTYLEYDDVFGPGSFVYEQQDSTHTLKVPDDATEPAVVLFFVEKGQTMLDTDGNVLSYETGNTILDYYRTFAAQQGACVDRVLT